MERQWMTLDQIKAEYASNDYNPELLLQHLLHHVEASPASVPEDYAIVPVEPTEEMMRAMTDPFIPVNGNTRKAFYWAYPRMLSAAPTPPVSEDRWQPIETAPKDGSKFLAWRRHSTIPLIVFYNAEYDQYECNDGNLVFSLTHWMPLPKAPTMQEDKPCQIS